MTLLKKAQSFEHQILRLGNLSLLVKAARAQQELAKAAEKSRNLYNQFLESQKEKVR